MTRSYHLASDPAPLLTRDECQSLATRILSFAKADETRVTIESAVRANTRFAVNQVSTAGYDVDTTVTVQSNFGQRSASMTTNKLDDATLAATVRSAETVARLVAENSERMGELGPQQYADQVKSGLSIPSAAERSAAVQAVTERAIKNKCEAFGYIESQAQATAIANSRGLFAYSQTGSCSMTATVRTPDGTGSGWAGTVQRNLTDIDATSIGEDAVQKALQSRNPVAVEPGRYTVILEPTAVGNLVQLILFAANARAADEGRSFFARRGGGNKIGERVVDERVTITSDPRDLGGSLFNSEGLPTKKVNWIDHGVVRALNYDRYWAKNQNVEPTSLGSYGFKMDGGNSSLPKMIESTERGILVTRFWYIRSVDPRTIMYTGLTRDGTFLIENGKITRPVKNFRYNDSPIMLLSNLEALGPSVPVSASEDGGAGRFVIVPALKSRDFHFTSLSDAI